MSTLILINTTVFVLASQPSKVLAGESVVSPAIQAALASAGGVLAPATDPAITAAAALAAKLRARGGDEQECTQVMMAAYASAAYQGAPVTVTVPVSLATIKAQTSGTAFSPGFTFPAGARLLAADINVLVPLSGGGTTAAHATVAAGTDAAGSIVASTDVFTAAGTFAPPGSNPYSNRGGQALKMTITGDGTHALSALTAGSLSVDVTYAPAAV